MAIVRYCIINSAGGLCTAVISWDDANTYYPPSGSIIAGDNTGEVGQTYSGGSSPGGTWFPASAPSYSAGSDGGPLAIADGGTGASDAATARTNLGLGTANSPQFTAVELGNASDTTLSRAAAGSLAVEGNLVPSPASQAHGDILFRGASSWERLAAGTSGQFLKTLGAGAAPAWDTPSGSGGWTTIGTYTPSNVASVDITNLSSYRMLRFTIINLRPATDNTTVEFRVSQNNGSTYSNSISSTDGAVLGVEYADGGTSAAGIGGDFNTELRLPFSDSIGNVATDGMLNAVLTLVNFNKAANKSAYVMSISGDGAALELGQFFSALYETTNIYNAIRLQMNSGNIAEGVIILEGFAG